MQKAPIIIGHRGAMGHYPENTLPSFEAAFLQGCDGIEFDVQQSSDGQILVFHDWELERCTDGQSLLREKTAAELRRLDAGSWYDASFLGTQIPTLKEVLDLVSRQDTEKLVNIEIKELFSEQRGTVEKIVAIVRSQSTEQQQNIVISSFSHNLLAQLHRLAPEIKIGLLVGDTLERLPGYIEQLSFPVFSYHPYISLLREEDVRWVRTQGIKIYPWTVNSKYQLETCLRLGVDGIMSNYPDIINKV
ncbi:glycerophosphodiester phosphodiesterase family protein [Candidatus Haliotispira prima]|uniref:Glycerophosphodiester phosphodiesterase family protein n=1 Tax=Candidatus Haliotispira prima TaxID=3034016 RepID=A0ABY8MFI0_9SPIO|nr:glycerophosphodiester phosphodiesterase family protein [Candidatus Haliotispira prima]